MKYKNAFFPMTTRRGGKNRAKSRARRTIAIARASSGNRESRMYDNPRPFGHAFKMKDRKID